MVAIAKRLELNHKHSLLQREHFKATHDALTGLLNPIALNERVDQEIALGARYNKSFAIVMLELDQFRNGDFGLSKSVSNPLLVDFAKRLQHCVRSTDTLARLEGDVFVVVLPDLQNFRNVVKVIENINQHLRDPFSINDTQYKLTANMGVALFPNDGHKRQQLMERAHVALFQSRNNPFRNYGFYDDDIDSDIVNAIDFENKVRDAIDQHQYDIHYSPINTLDGNALSFVEAETVWHDNELRNADKQAIDQCIDSLELSKLVGDVQLTSICQQLLSWQGDVEYGSTPVLINLKAAQFHDPQLPKRYQTIISSQAVDPGRIGFVVKEQDILQDCDFAGRQIGALKQMGCRIIIDEFSCGLSYVGKLNLAAVDMIRLKSELIHQMDDQIEWLCIVEGVIRIGKQLNVATIISHIDSDYQYQTLLNVNGDYWQGNYTFVMTDGPQGTDHCRLLDVVNGEPE
ncbi:MAG: EAL domain-containing protein [Gammaproteobacteria bacterium]|jgi:diguanylate cyclase (GGDEF)-like protein